MSQQSRCRAFTLVELLIVVAILVVLAAFMIPAIKPALQDRKTRESARMLNLFLSGAQSKAIERGRPVGVWLERNPVSPNECIQLYLAEAPLPYAGDVQGARASISQLAPNLFLAQFNAFNPSVGLIPNFVRPGDSIKFDYKGTTFPIVAVNNSSANSVEFTGDPETFLMPALSPSVAYQILRQPTRNNATTFTLPAGTSINLHLSGLGVNGPPDGGVGLPANRGFGATGGPNTSFPGNPLDLSPIVITFNPSGRLDLVFSQGNGMHATDSIYLFVARNDKVLPRTLPDGSAVLDANAPNITDHYASSTDRSDNGQIASDLPLDALPGHYLATGDPVHLNIDDLSNLWVTVGHRTGSVITVENKSTVGMPVSNINDWQLKIAEARRFAREKTSMGGR